MGSSIVQSLSQALHSLQNPHFSQQSSSSLLRSSKTSAPDIQAFDLDVKDRLFLLENSDHDCLSLSWLHDAVNLVLYAFTSVLRTNLSLKEKEKAFVDANIDDSLKLLDACNGLKEIMNDIEHYVMLVRYSAQIAANMMKTATTGEDWVSKLDRSFKALHKSLEFLRSRDEEINRKGDGRSKLETFRSIIRRMGEHVSRTVVSPSNVVFLQIHASKVLAIFVCNILAMAFSTKPNRDYAILQVPDSPAWSASLIRIQDNAKKLAHDGTLMELDTVSGLTKELMEILSTISAQRSGPSANERENLSRHINLLSQHSDELHQGLLVLQQQIDDLFRMLMTVRVNFLDALCNS